MPAIPISVSSLKKRVERKAYAYGVSSTVAALLGEYVIEVLREAGGVRVPAPEDFLPQQI
jgi:hypothetical protein